MLRAAYVAIPSRGIVARILPVLGVLTVILLWYVAGKRGWGGAFVPTPWATVKALAAMFHDKDSVTDSTAIVHGWASVSRVIKAVFYASLVGIPIGILMGTFGRVEAYLKWVVFPLKTAPVLAFVPIFMLIFDIGEAMKVGFLFFGTIVYIIPLTFDAIRAVPEEYVDAAVDYGFKPLGAMWHFLIPAAWPRIFDAIKVCTGIAWTYLVAAEIINVTTGLGKVLSDAKRFQNYPKMWAGILLILAIGVLTDYILGQIRNRFFNWEA